MASITLTDKVSDEELRKDHEHCLTDRMASLQRELELYGCVYTRAMVSRDKGHTILRVTGEREERWHQSDVRRPLAVPRSL